MKNDINFRLFFMLLSMNQTLNRSVAIESFPNLGNLEKISLHWVSFKNLHVQ